MSGIKLRRFSIFFVILALFFCHYLLNQLHFIAKAASRKAPPDAGYARALTSAAHTH